MSAVEENIVLQQYLSFRLQDETFAVDVRQVKEIIDRIAITRVPQMPRFVLGVINLRGAVVPVIDLRSKFGLPPREGSRDTCIVVLEVEIDGQDTVVGALVDSVREVLELDPAQIEPPPRLGSGMKVDFIQGMGEKGGEFQIILNARKVFSNSELAAFGELVREREVATV